jgi:hypothetical protein
MEIVDVKSPRGLAKIAGTVVSFAGVTTMTLYKGAAIPTLWKSPVHIPTGTSAHEGWVKGSILAVASCICWAVWYIMQVPDLPKPRSNVNSQHAYIRTLNIFSISFWSENGRRRR